MKKGKIKVESSNDSLVDVLLTCAKMYVCVNEIKEAARECNEEECNDNPSPSQ